MYVLVFTQTLVSTRINIQVFGYARYIFLIIAFIEDMLAYLYGQFILVVKKFLCYFYETTFTLKKIKSTFTYMNEHTVSFKERYVVTVRRNEIAN